MATFKHPDDVSIDPPTLPNFHPDRAIECQDAIAGALTKLIDEAEGMGWHVNEITAAITDLADSHHAPRSGYRRNELSFAGYPEPQTEMIVSANANAWS